MGIAIYLRKSRADEELEKTLGQGETLVKHRKALLKFAKEKDLNVIEIKEEIVSGESIIHRPKMIELLQEIEQGTYDGVLVMDMQRLGRGDMQDQGIILSTFKKSNTKIITPQKTYDLNNDFDEEYSEFEAFMSRKELKMINRRMQGGRVRSIEEGNYISPNPPFGYDIEYINKSRSLKINEYEAEIIRTIFDMYINSHGAGSISNYLNSLGYKTKAGKAFESSSILFIIKNPVYIGKITWKKKEIKKSLDPGKVKDTKTRDRSEWIIVNGKHKPIISEDIFDQAQKILEGKYHIPYQLNAIVNPLAGVVICKICGSKMVLRKYGSKDPHIICMKKCGNKSSKFKYVEQAVLSALEDRIKKLKIKGEKNKNVTDDTTLYTKQLDSLNKELDTLNKQRLKLFDLLEQGVYDNDTFIERSKNINERIDATKLNIETMNNILNNKKQASTKDIDVNKAEDMLDIYKNNGNIALKNELLKNMLFKVEYYKSKKSRNDDFDITLFTKF